MNTPAAEVIIPIVLFAMIFGIVYVVVTARHRQRMAMIDKGLTPAEVFERRDPHRSLKMGMLSIGVGIGLLLGYLFKTYLMVGGRENDDPLAYFIAVTICAGSALIGHHVIVQRMEKGKE